MSMRTVSPNIDITRVDTSPGYPLGAMAEVKSDTYNQWFTYIYVQNAAGAVWANGNSVARIDAATNYTCRRTPVSAPPARIAGYAQGPWVTPAGVSTASVASLSYVWVLREGMAEVLAGAAGITANTAIIQSAAGVEVGLSVDCAAVTNASFGWSTETVLGGALATCRVSCVG